MAGGCSTEALAEFFVPMNSKLSQTLKDQSASLGRYRYRLEGNGHPCRKPPRFEAKLRESLASFRPQQMPPAEYRKRVRACQTGTGVRTYGLVSLQGHESLIFKALFDSLWRKSLESSSPSAAYRSAFASCRFFLGNHIHHCQIRCLSSRCL